ncbi:GDSL-like Lipase/Acylhydrolase [Seminavis robusta]|uniref:GDSL-like Lipase/Acylhydrolase n=1 Tax=Seminavis robusta TaxID=568900 RepID=A0A9N8EUV1_9STRA|nr:GDSL-like Lipase/Acylhydrolase [Seminavis robusta]|eukprot:Sro1755_g295560.1 GDSL-like Lipase/Acylhydrolase (312) ;mRNA; r:17869-18804
MRLWQYRYFLDARISPWRRILAGVGALVLLVISGTLYNNNSTTTSASSGSSRDPNSSGIDQVQVKNEQTGTINGKKHTIRILCYGDSLTAGMAPPSREYCPYSQALQTTLNDNNNNSDYFFYQADHIGLPGWTTTQFLAALDDPRKGLRTALHSSQHDVDTKLVILLAGTNDIPLLVRSMSLTSHREADHREGHIQNGASVLKNNLIRLHDVVLADHTMHSIALAIPPSGRQLTDLSAARLVDHANEQLQQSSRTTPYNDTMTFVPFPISYDEANEHLWSPDGLHLNCEGYELLGKTLAPIVREVLDKGRT